MPLLLLLFAAILALIFSASVLFNAPPKNRSKIAPRTSAKADWDSDISYKKTIGF